jgi:glycosyltransferase involved in cell wall biosynthesis
MSVSIITPVHNASRYIGESIESVLGQSFSDWEMIIVDDCSTDNSVNIIQSFSDNDSRINLIQLSENSGAAVARNAAIGAAQGRYIAFLDSDDIWMPHKLATQLAFMQSNNYPFVYSAYGKIDEEGRVIGHIGVPDKVSYSDLLKTCSIGCLTAIYDTAYFGKVTMPLIRKRQDFGLWLKLLKEVDFAYGIKDTLGQYRVRSNSISSNKASTVTYTWRLYREIEKLSVIKASYYFLHYAMRGVLRTKAPGLARKLGVLN